MPSIGILEFLYHHIFLYSLALIANESGAEVTILTTENLYKLVAPLFKDRVRDYKWVIKGSNESLWSFLKRVEKIAGRELDLLFVNTLQGRGQAFLSYLMFIPRCKTILATGRITYWFGDKYLFPSWERIKCGVNVAHFVRKRILPRFDGIIVHDEAMKNYALDHNYEKEIFVLPFSIYEGSPALYKDTPNIKFAVTGEIAEHRRDYDSLLNAFEKLWASGKRNIELTLVGRPGGKYWERIISRCRLLKEAGFGIQFYEEFIPEEVFSHEVASADVLINPIRPLNYPHGIFTSGLVEAIRHAKPGIYPADYIVPKELESSSLFYGRITELSDLIERSFLNNAELLGVLSEKARANSEEFSLQRVTEHFKECLLERLF